MTAGPPTQVMPAQPPLATPPGYLPPPPGNTPPPSGFIPPGYPPQRSGMSPATLVLCVAAGVVIGGIALCGVGASFATRQPAESTKDDSADKVAEHWKIIRRYAREDYQTFVDKRRSKGDGVREVFLEGGTTRTITLPANPFSIYFSVRENQSTIEPAPRALGTIEAAGHSTIEMRAKDKFATGLADVPEDWSGQVTLMLKGAPSARIAIVGDPL